MHTARRSTRRGAVATIALAVALLATGLGALGAPRPASAAPPPASHGALVDPNPIDHTPHVLDGRTEAVLDLGSRVVVGGTFTRVKRWNQPGELARPYLFAYDKATGTVDTAFLPAPNGRVSALLLAADGKILVSGQFKAIGGRSIPYLAKLDPTTGAAVASFAPSPSGMVYDLHQAGGHLYVGGTFTKVGGTARTNFAILDPVTGALRPGPDVAFAAAPRGTTRVMRLDVTPDGRRLVAIGNFGRVGGQVRQNVAVLDLTTSGSATVSGWRTDRYADQICGSGWDTVVYDVDIAPDGGWFVIVTTGGGWGPSRLCDTATRWEIGGTGEVQPTWSNWTGGDTLTSVAITGAAVYVAGHNRWLDNPNGRDTKGAGAVDRPGIGALAPATGKALAWNPTRERGLVAPRIVATAEGGLYVLSDSSRFAGEWHPRLTYLTLTGRLPGTPPPTAVTPSAPGAPVVSAPTATSATLAWAAPLSSGSSAITDHVVTAWAGSSAVATRSTGTARSTTFAGLPAGRALTFTVTARNAAGVGPASPASEPTVLPFRTVDAFTAQQFRDVLGRAPTGAESADWRARVGGGAVTPGAAVDALLTTAGATRVAGVVRLYRASFLRNPDAAGFRYWRDQVRRGVSLAAISQSFAASPEFRQRYGALDDAGFVRLVYRNVLGRNPDAAGQQYWVGRLRAGVSRGKVMIGFSESPENVAATRRTTDVLLVFHLLLDRPPTTAERTAREAQLAAGTTRAALLQAILVTAEYDARV